MRHQIARTEQDHVLPESLLTYDVNQNRLRLHDGKTEGGLPVNKAVNLLAKTSFVSGKDSKIDITNYDDTASYSVSIDNGDATINGRTITVNAPLGENILTVDKDGVKENFVVETTLPITGEATQLSNGPAPRRYHSAVAINDKMYVFGGRDDSDSNFSDLWEYDPATDTWQELTAGPPARYGHACAAIGDKMVIFSGRDNDYLTDTWIYDTLTDTWEEKASNTSMRVVGTAAAGYKGKFYLFGGAGENRHGYSDSFGRVMEYDPATDEWSYFGSFTNTERSSHALVVIGTTAYVLGGTWNYRSNDSVLTLNMETGVRGSVKDLPRDASRFKAVNVGGTIFTFSISGTTIHYYDPELDQWNSMPGGATRRSGHSAVVINDKMYVYGGRGNDANGNRVYLNDLWVFE